MKYVVIVYDFDGVSDVISSVYGIFNSEAEAEKLSLKFNNSEVRNLNILTEIEIKEI